MLATLAVIATVTAITSQINDAALKDLGKHLFFDRRMSAPPFTTACADCHNPDTGWGDARKRAVGRIGVSTSPNGLVGDFNSPTILNARFKIVQFWNGRATGLTDQALQPLTNQLEMGNVSRGQVVNRIARIPMYAIKFQQAFGTPGVSESRMAAALARFERDINSGNAPIDKYIAGNTKALTDSQKRGWKLVNKHRCTECHDPRNDFRDGFAHNTGVSARFADGLRGANNRREFVTPTWRELARTGPYTHSGVYDRIGDVVDHYDSGAYFRNSRNQIVRDARIDKRVKPLFLTKQEKADMVQFLTTATAGDYPYVENPFR